MTNSGQSVTASLTLSAFGQTVASSGSSTSAYMFGATSGYRNEGDAGLTLVGCRFYDAQVGRFITRDTYLDQAAYAYCDGDPINRLDPSGHDGRDVADHLFCVLVGLGSALALPICGAGVILIAVGGIGMGITNGLRLGDDIAEKIESWPGPPEDAPEPDPAHEVLRVQHEQWMDGQVPKDW